jgi:hypothetical protein
MTVAAAALYVACPAAANEVDWVSGQNSGSSTELTAGGSAGKPSKNDEGTDHGSEEEYEGEPINVIEIATGLVQDYCGPGDPTTCEGDPTTPTEEPVAPVVVTLRDIASFRPATPGNGMEPAGWAIEGLPANFVAAASVEVVSGTLLGQPADVRFTPVGYRWAHSDGAVVEASTSGATWAALGLREFSNTATSHVYAASGVYTVELEVVLRAEYRFAGSAWRAIAGTLTVAGEPQRVLVGEVDTVLTRGDCNANPTGPGC